MSTSKTTPTDVSYELPHFPPEELHATLDYLAGMLPPDADLVHRQRLDYLRRLVNEQSLVMRAASAPAKL